MTMQSEMTPYERAAKITYLLLGMHRVMTTNKVAEEVGISRQGALWLLRVISRVVPIFQDEELIWREQKQA